MEHRKTTGVGIRWMMMGLWLLAAGCGQAVFENAGSPNSLLEDRKACAVELKQSPAARAYRQNPTVHPDYVNQVFIEMDRCIERKGWKQVKSQQEPAREAITPQVAQTRQSAPRSDPTIADNTADDTWPEENGDENN